MKKYILISMILFASKGFCQILRQGIIVYNVRYDNSSKISIPKFLGKNISVSDVRYKAVFDSIQSYYYSSDKDSLINDIKDKDNYTYRNYPAKAFFFV